MDDLCSSETGLKHLVSKGSSKTLTSLSSTSTHSEPLVFARPGLWFAPVSHHILRIVFDPVKDSIETPYEDRFYASMSVDPSVAKDICHLDWELTNEFIMDKRPLCHSFIDHLVTPGQFSCLVLEHAELVRSKLKRRLTRRDAGLENRDAEIERLRKLMNEKPFREMSWLRLGFEGAKREVGRLRKQVEELKVEAGKGQVDGETEVKAEYAQMLDNQQGRFDERVATLDARLDKMMKETDEELAPIELLGTHLGAFISVAISDGMGQGLEVRLVHGKKGTDINSIPAYNPNVTEDEAGTSTNPTFNSTSSVGGVTEQFIIASSVPYAGDAGATAKDVTSVDEVATVESDVDVLVGTASNPAAIDVFAFGPSTLAIPK
ncbi:hypothetical protein Tco_0864532 [Tanacetum coccineum]